MHDRISAADMKRFSASTATQRLTAASQSAGTPSESIDMGTPSRIKRSSATMAGPSSEVGDTPVTAWYTMTPRL
jgi:hypothetical protein